MNSESMNEERSQELDDFGPNIQKSEEEILIQDSDSNSVISEIQEPSQRAESLSQSLKRFTNNFSEVSQQN